MTDRAAFDNYLRSLEPERLRDVISSLEAYEDEFGKDHVVPGAIVLLNLLPELPEQQRGMFDFGARMVVGRVVYRLVRSLKDQNAVETAVKEILPQVSTLSSKLELITDIGYRENAGHKLVSESAAKTFEKEWRSEVRAANADTLAEEKGLLYALLFAKRETDAIEPPIEIADAPRLTLALLQSARSDVRSQSMGSRNIRLSPRLAWDILIELYGDEGILRERIEMLKASQLEDTGDLLQLADKYLGGWRPKDFGED